MRKIFLLTIIFAVWISFSINDVVDAMDEELLGPILLSRAVRDTIVTFQDVGTGNIWQVEIPFGLHTFSWSPDGCAILLMSSTQDWYTLHVREREFNQITSLHGNRLIWSPHSGIVTVTLIENDIPNIYNLDLNTGQLSFLLENGGPIQWLSETELLYARDRYAFVWNILEGESTQYGDGLRLLYSYPTDIGLLNQISWSPNWLYVASFYSLHEYFMYTSPEFSPEELTEAQIEELEQVPQIPGFTVHFLNEGTTRYVDVNGAFLRTVEWSPSSQRVSITTHPSDAPDDSDGIYIYTIETEMLERIGSFPSLYAAEHGPYVATWSPDEQWLAFQTRDNPILYRIADGQIINLDERMQSLRISWSPVMDYSSQQCLTD